MPIIGEIYKWAPTPAPFDVQQALLVWLGIGEIDPVKGFGVRPPPLVGAVKPPTME